MRLETFEGERKISDLVGRFHAISGRGAAAKAREAERALLEANPHLKEMRRVPEGALIVVPDLPGVNPARSRPGTGPSRPAFDVLRPAIERGSEAVAASLAQAAARAGEEAAALKDREVRAALREAPALEKAAAAAGAAAADRAKRARELQRLSAQALKVLADDLEAFARVMGVETEAGKPPPPKRTGR